MHYTWLPITILSWKFKAISNLIKRKSFFIETVMKYLETLERKQIFQVKFMLWAKMESHFHT